MNKNAARPLVLHSRSTRGRQSMNFQLVVRFEQLSAVKFLRRKKMRREKCYHKKYYGTLCFYYSRYYVVDNKTQKLIWRPLDESFNLPQLAALSANTITRKLIQQMKILRGKSAKWNYFWLLLSQRNDKKIKETSASNQTFKQFPLLHPRAPTRKHYCFYCVSNHRNYAAVSPLPV